MGCRTWASLSSMTFLLGILLSVTHAYMESADSNWTWPWIRALIFRRIHTFELQNPWNKATELNTIPWSSPVNRFATIWKIWEHTSISTSVIRSCKNNARPNPSQRNEPGPNSSILTPSIGIVMGSNLLKQQLKTKSELDNVSPSFLFV